MGLYAAELLNLDLPQTEKRLLTFVETDGCFADGVSVVTGCWLGHRTLRLVEYGKGAGTFVDRQRERAIRVWPRALLADARSTTRTVLQAAGMRICMRIR